MHIFLIVTIANDVQYENEILGKCIFSHYYKAEKNSNGFFFSKISRCFKFGNRDGEIKMKRNQRRSLLILQN